MWAASALQQLGRVGFVDRSARKTGSAVSLIVLRRVPALKLLLAYSKGTRKIPRKRKLAFEVVLRVSIVCTLRDGAD